MSQSLGDIIRHENPYCEPVEGPFIIDLRTGPGAPFDQDVPFTVQELPLSDPRYAQGIFVTLPGPDANKTKAVRCSKLIAIRTRSGREILVAYVGGGGGQ